MSTLSRNIPGVISSFQYYIYSLRDKARNGCFFQMGNCLHKRQIPVRKMEPCRRTGRYGGEGVMREREVLSQTTKYGCSDTD